MLFIGFGVVAKLVGRVLDRRLDGEVQRKGENWAYTILHNTIYVYALCLARVHDWQMSAANKNSTQIKYKKIFKKNNEK